MTRLPYADAHTSDGSPLVPWSLTPPGASRELRNIGNCGAPRPSAPRCRSNAGTPRKNLQAVVASNQTNRKPAWLLTISANEYSAAFPIRLHKVLQIKAYSIVPLFKPSADRSLIPLPDRRESTHNARKFFECGDEKDPLHRHHGFEFPRAALKLAMKNQDM